MKCNQCETGVEGKSRGKTIFFKWRSIAILTIAVFVIGTLVGCGGDSAEKINWSDMELGDRLPEPPSNRGNVIINSDEELYVGLEKVEDKKYNEYYDACVEMGFNIDGDKTGSIYEAYDAEGYYLRLSHIGDELTVNLKCPPEFSEIEWPNSTAGNLLPAPKSTVGEFSFEHDDSFYVELGNTSKEDYNDYVKACSEKGFTVDYDKGDDYYYADNADGWHLSLNYKGNNIMAISIDKPDGESEITESETTELETTESETSEPETTESEATESETAESETTESETTEPETTTASVTDENGLRPDFKEAMDSYEAFMDEYVAFMKKYEDNPTDMGILADYAKYISKYADFVADFEKWEDTEMNAAETAYYIDVQARVSKKLLEVAQ